MPTKRRRHAITETPPVQLALDELRRELGTDRVEVGELLILGAREKVARLRAEQHRRAELVKHLAARIRNRQVQGDPEAAEHVRRAGWARE